MLIDIMVDRGEITTSNPSFSQINLSRFLVKFNEILHKTLATV